MGRLSSEQEGLPIFYEGHETIFYIKPLPIFRKPHKAAPVRNA